MPSPPSVCGQVPRPFLRRPIQGLWLQQAAPDPSAGQAAALQAHGASVMAEYAQHHPSTHFGDTVAKVWKFEKTPP